MPVEDRSGTGNTPQKRGNIAPDISHVSQSISVRPWESLADNNIKCSRWIRLLFGREFPLEHQLLLWDGLFALDPGLGLVDFICVAMLLRIRWEREFE